MDKETYQVFDRQGACIMTAPASCRYPARVELSILEAGYAIRLNGKRVTKSDIRKESNTK